MKSLNHKDEERNTAVVTERHGLTARRLNSAIDEFIAELKYIEARSTHAPAGMDELLIATTKAIMEMSDACEEFERSVDDRTVVKQAQISFRERTAELFSKSYFMNRARTWPRGYAGDFETIEGVYRNIPKSDGVGYYLDRYFLGTTLPGAVRDRKNMLRSLVKKELAQRHAPRVLDLACGSSREVIEMAPEIIASGARFTFVDYDADALAFSRDRIGYAGIPPEQTAYRKYNAFKMINHERNLKEFGQQDVIYSVGFFDYLKDEVLIGLLSSLYRLLNPGGALITSFKDCRRYRSQEYHWFVDWDGFYLRTEDESRSCLLRAGIPENSIATVRDESGVIIFMTATR